MHLPTVACVHLVVFPTLQIITYNPSEWVFLALQPSGCVQASPKAEPLAVTAGCSIERKIVLRTICTSKWASEQCFAHAHVSFGISILHLFFSPLQLRWSHTHTASSLLFLRPWIGCILIIAIKLTSTAQIDSSTTVCSAPDCQSQFGFFNRRHHCRKCGNIFCAQHSALQVRLNEHALFHPEGDVQRACDRCYHQFREWEKTRSSRQNSDSSGSSSNSTHAVHIGMPATAKRPDNQRVGSIASSFQGAWNWSTF
jgi:hypothetical protein